MQNTNCSTKVLFLGELKNACIACKGKPLQLMFIIPFTCSFETVNLGSVG